MHKSSRCKESPGVNHECAPNAWSEAQEKINFDSWCRFEGRFFVVQIIVSMKATEFLRDTNAGLVILFVSIYALFFISDFGLTELYDPTRSEAYDWASKTTTNNLSSRLSLHIHEPKEESLVFAPTLNFTVSGDVLTDMTGQLVNLEVLVNGVRLNLKDGVPFECYQCGATNAHLDLYQFIDMETGLYKIEVLAQVSPLQLNGRQVSEVRTSSSTLFYYVRGVEDNGTFESVLSAEHLTSKDESDSSVHKSNMTITEDSQSIIALHSKSIMEIDPNFAVEYMPIPASDYSRSTEANSDSTWIETFKRIQIISPLTGTTVYRDLSMSATISSSFLESSVVNFLLTVDGTDYDITLQIREQLPLYNDFPDRTLPTNNIGLMKQIFVYLEDVPKGSHNLTLSVNVPPPVSSGQQIIESDSVIVHVSH